MFKIEKVKTICCYLAENVSDLYVTKLYKLLYYIDFISFAKRHASVTGDVYYKLPYGPVPTLIKNEIDNLSLQDKDTPSQLSKFVELKTVDTKNNRRIVKSLVKKTELKNLSPFEQRLVERVAMKFKKTFATTLSNKTHREAPYKFSSENGPISYEYAEKLNIKSILG